MRRPLLFLLALLLLCASTVRSGQPLRVLFWNVENLFDTVHDEGFLDQEFLPQSDRHWSSYRYWHKLTEVARVVAAVGDDGDIPDLIGLCEVENDSVLTMLTRRSILKALDYHYVMTRSEDARGIDVALLYQPARFRLLDHHSVRVPSREEGLRATRDILYAKGLVQVDDEGRHGIDTLHVLVVHLPSRAGGREGDRNRLLAAKTLWSVVDSIMNHTSSNIGNQEQTVPRIVVMGDFNASRGDRIFKKMPLRIMDDKKAPGTYCYQGLWQWIDHILVSSSVATQGKARPLRLPWLLEENKTYGGDMPRRTFRGPLYHGGVSDHLPVLLDLQL